LIGTLSASDLRCCVSTTEDISTWSTMSVLEWCQKVWVSKHCRAGATLDSKTNEWQVKPPVTCRLNTTLGEVMALTLEHRIHRVWITDDQGLLMGLVALSDILSVFHK
jgi:signal-transduction protein with cAMP-binding, CBS, and nucleotidyltransferase domain